jgi:hypothetical protein
MGRRYLEATMKFTLTIVGELTDENTAPYRRRGYTRFHFEGWMHGHPIHTARRAK